MAALAAFNRGKPLSAARRVKNRLASPWMPGHNAGMENDITDCPGGIDFTSECCCEPESYDLTMSVATDPGVMVYSPTLNEWIEIVPPEFEDVARGTR